MSTLAPPEDYGRGGPPLSVDETAEHLKEKHLQMIMDAQQHGRAIPAVGLDPRVLGDELARTSVEASQRTMRRANKRSFVIPKLPWLKG